jgi:hypothetical protein
MAAALSREFSAAAGREDRAPSAETRFYQALLKVPHGDPGTALTRRRLREAARSSGLQGLQERQSAAVVALLNALRSRLCRGAG